MARGAEDIDVRLFLAKLTVAIRQNPTGQPFPRGGWKLGARRPHVRRIRIKGRLVSARWSATWNSLPSAHWGA